MCLPPAIIPPWVRSTSEAWEVSLALLQDHRKIATIGAHCNGCGHEHRWPIEGLIAQHKPWTTPRSGEAVEVFDVRWGSAQT